MELLIDPALDGTKDDVGIDDGLFLVVEGCEVIGIESVKIGKPLGF